MSKLTGIVLGLALVSGCASQPMYVRPAAAAWEPGEADALVVFIRPSGWSSGSRTFIFGEEGSLLTEVPAQSSVAVRLPAGAHRLMVFAEYRPAMAMFDWETYWGPGRAFHMQLAPAKTYYVEVSAHPGAVDLFAIAPRMRSWERREEWLSATTRYDPAPEAGESYYDAELVKEKLAEAGAQWASLSEEYRAERSVVPEDGL